MKKFLFLIAIVLALNSIPTRAQGLNFHWVKDSTKVETTQQPVAQDISDELKTQAQIIAELKALRIIVAAKDGQIAALNGQIESKNQTIAFVVEQRDFYKSASLERKTAGTLDDQNIMILRQQIADDRQEIRELRRENDSLRSSRDRRTIFAVIAGAGLGYVVHK